MAEAITDEGVFLWKVRHGDHGFVVRFFTRQGGAQSLLMQGIKGRKSSLSAYLFPLSILELEIAAHQGKGMLRLKDLRLTSDAGRLQFDVHKHAVAGFLAELLYRALPEQHPDSTLFAFLKYSASELNQRENIANFHLSFLLQLSHFLGFYPQREEHPSGTQFLDLREGRFVRQRPLHLDYIESYFAGLWMDIMDNGADISSLRRSDRRELLEQMLRYYALHLQGMKSLRSLDVLHELYN
jgi:DNA repair protein RecO (recombination protein O)